jgi:2-polyprenyl-3-methyl-5-hydroxy-6-metoxy-1,4-benzoquinol methylase
MQERSGHIRWNQVANSYLDSLDGPYHANRLDMVRALVQGIEFSDTRCFDFGCGDGIFMEWLAVREAAVGGVDANKTMIGAATARLSELGERLLLLREGGVAAMETIDAASFDCVFALNVLAYLEPDEEAAFYKEARRVLRPGGQLIVTHSNELFDMFTFNKYTVAFFARHFSFGQRKTDISSLLAHPDKPSRSGFAVRENPLNYRGKLAEHGFGEEQQEFAILHELPPLLTPEIDFDAINTRRYPATIGWPERDRWKLMFLCSIFGSRAVRL